MKQLIGHIKQSIFSPEYYHTLLTRPASFSWKYYWSFSMFLAVIVTIITSLPIVPKINTVLHNLPASFMAYYPDALEVNVNNGVVTTNVPEPYFLPLPGVLASSFSTTSGVAHLMVIDTMTPVTRSQFQSYQSLFWVSGRSVAYVNQNDVISIAPLRPQMQYTFNETNLRGTLAQIEPYFKFAPPILVLIIFFALIVRFTINLAYLLIAAVFIYFIGRFLKQQWGYGASYRIALHAVTLPILVDQLFAFVFFGGVHIAVLLSLLLVVVFINYREPKVLHEAPSPTE